MRTEALSPDAMHAHLVAIQERYGTLAKVAEHTTPYYFADDEEYVRVFYGFAGRFAAVPGNGTRVMDSKRVGGGTMLTDERRVGSLLQSSGEAKRQAGGLGE